LVYINLLTPHPDIRIARLNERTVEIRDGEETTILGVGHTRLGALAIEAEMFAISLTGDSLTLQGIERLGFAEGEHWDWQVFDGEPATLTVGQSEMAQSICDALDAVVPEPPPAMVEPSRLRPEGGWTVKWSRDLGPTEISAVAVHDEILLAGTEEGEVVQLGLEDGAAMWSHRLDPDSAPSALLLADIDADGAVEALVGTDDGQLAALAGHSGEQRWCKTLKDSGWGAKVSGLAVADLEGRSRTSVIASTVGWYINAFAADGTLEWAEWVRYHAITALAAADVDGDGKAEVIAGTEYSTPLNVHNSDGSFRWTTFEEVGSEGNATTPRRGIGLTHLQLVDVDGDGVREIAYGTQDGWIYAVKPQDGAEVWHVNIVGEVVGLIAFPWGLVAASEFGELYAFSYRGELRWHVQIGEWIRAIAPVGEYIVAAVEKGALLACDADGRCVGFVAMEAEIRGLWPCHSGVVCSLAGGRLSCVELGVD
ncbi:MAG: PQQ-binding-like beta-propeller repeat protein, partial [Gemmatimonadetes bacterium]|nr:PQQ-binding-like beta-propeller repeat protein [Gemmatimonadota bacterium]